MRVGAGAVAGDEDDGVGASAVGGGVGWVAAVGGVDSIGVEDGAGEEDGCGGGGDDDGVRVAAVFVVFSFSLGLMIEVKNAFMVEGEMGWRCVRGRSMQVPMTVGVRNTHDAPHTQRHAYSPSLTRPSSGSRTRSSSFSPDFWGMTMQRWDSK